MGFWDSLSKTVGSFSEMFAKQIDRMTDEEIEEKFVSKNPDKSVSYYRDFAARSHEHYARREK